MTDEEFEIDIADSLQGSYIYDDCDGGRLKRAPDQYIEDEPDVVDLVIKGDCVVCGSAGACGYDAEGRPMIHTYRDED